MSQTAEQKREWYLTNRDQHLARSRTRHATRRREIHAHIAGHLAANPCVDCGEADPIVLDFDHMGDKQFNIANAAWKLVSIPSLTAEIAKCVIRCANCHRRKTHHLGTHRSVPQGTASAVAATSGETPTPSSAQPGDA